MDLVVAQKWAEVITIKDHHGMTFRQLRNATIELQRLADKKKKTAKMKTQMAYLGIRIRNLYVQILSQAEPKERKACLKCGKVDVSRWRRGEDGPAT